MESVTKQVLEALKMQPLSEDEKKRRHILGRLYGPIATTKEKTRNGRGYNRELWDKALSDDIFKEKLATKSLFLELGHPADREETDMKMVCACIPEMPKIVDGDLYAYVDILDTETGRLLKTLCDYGFVPGISSRGSGDIMANDEVDPETFFLETWDIVALPAVKKARLSVCESLGKKPLKAVLRESYDSASEDEKKVMQEALNNLDIGVSLLKEEDIPYEDPEEYVCTDSAECEEGYTGNPAERTTHLEYTDDDPTDGKAVLPDNIEKQLTEETEEPATGTVGAFINELRGYDEELPLEWKPITVGGDELQITAVTLETTDDGRVVANINYSLPEAEPEAEDNQPSEEEVPQKAEEASPADEAEPEAEEHAEEAGDAGSEGLLESMKELIRQKDELEKENKDVIAQKAVGDAEVKKLSEELSKYRKAYQRVCELAHKRGEAEAENKKLQEQLSEKDTEINKLKSEAASNSRLTESIAAKDAEAKKLTEKLLSAQKEADDAQNDLKEQLSACRKQLQAKDKAISHYKAKCNEIMEGYVASKASLLGVRPQDIVGQLKEGYTLKDVDDACETLLTESIGWSGLPFGLSRGQAKIQTQEPAKRASAPEEGYEIDDDLLELAGLK